MMSIIHGVDLFAEKRRKGPEQTVMITIMMQIIVIVIMIVMQIIVIVKGLSR
jgi:hypothetical protein